MWELDTLVKLKQLDAWTDLNVLNRPKIIGPDRASVSHSINVLESFSGSVTYIRPSYADQVDIIGS